VSTSLVTACASDSAEPWHCARYSEYQLSDCMRLRFSWAVTLCILQWVPA